MPTGAPSALADFHRARLHPPYLAVADRLAFSNCSTPHLLGDQGHDPAEYREPCGSRLRVFDNHVRERSGTWNRFASLQKSRNEYVGVLEQAAI